MKTASSAVPSSKAVDFRRGALLAISALCLAAGSAGAQDAPWLRGLSGKHRQLFDTPAPGNGVALVHVLNYYDTYNSAFKAADKDVEAIFTFYGSTTFHGLSDAMWAKYRIGEFLGEKDAKGTPYTANPWRTTPNVMGNALAAASVEALQKRGATFILCNNALTVLSGMVAGARGLDAKAVYEDMRSNILPGVTLVPAMVIAIEQAQRAGFTYLRQ